MALHRFPIVVWQDAQKYYTALVIGDSIDGPLAATALTADRAREQLKDYLTWLHQREPWRSSSELTQLELKQFMVPVRAEYRSDRRVYAGSESFALHVPCVTGHEQSGPYFALLPTLDLQFYFHEPNALGGLVAEYAQQKLKGSSSRELARFLPPDRIVVDEIVVRVKDEVPRQTAGPNLTTLDLVAEPLDDRAARRRFSRAWLRESEAATLASQLASTRSNLLLVGPTGVGKTTLLAEAVRQLQRQQSPQADGDTPVERHPLRFWLTSAGRLIAGMQYLGQWEQRCQRVIEELSQASGVLCIESLLDLALAGGQDAGDGVAMFFLPYLERGELRLVGEATPSELTALRRHLPSLVDLFQIVPVEPLARPQALAVLDRLALARRQQLGITVADGVSELAYDLFHRFSPYDTFPGQTVRFFDDLFDRTKRESRAQVTAAATVAAFIRRTGLPEFMLRDELPISFDDVLAGFRREVIGQEAACRAAAQLAVNFKAGLNDPHRPLGVLLFCGPTGVGKTQLAKALSRYFFGHGDKQDRLVRLDMSEYGGFDAAERLLGRPNGPPSELVKRVRQQPFVVVLLDEIEKASGEVFDALLGMFDEGRLTDPYGRTTNFRSAVIIMTSNLGAESPPPAGFDASAQPSYEGAVASFFRPEFFNRIDAVVRFAPLAHADVLEITRKELAEIASREGLTKSGLSIDPSDRLVEHLADIGYDARYGARPLQRALERHVVSPLACWLLSNRHLSHVRLRLDLGAANFLQVAASES